MIWWPWIFLGDRLIKPLLTECQRCLDDGIVDSADLLDAGVIFGTGFAPFSAARCITWNTSSRR